MDIDRDVPDGKTLLAGCVKFVGPTHATGRVKDGTVLILIDTPEEKQLTKEEVDDIRARHLLSQTDAKMARAAEELCEIQLGSRSELSREVQDVIAARIAVRADVLSRTR